MLFVLRISYGSTANQGTYTPHLLARQTDKNSCLTPPAFTILFPNYDTAVFAFNYVTEKPGANPSGVFFDAPKKFP